MMEIKKMRTKMKMYRALFIIFAVLTLVGLVYVIANGGEPDAGYAMVPMVMGAIFSSLYQDAKKTVADLEKKQ